MSVIIKRILVILGTVVLGTGSGLAYEIGSVKEGGTIQGIVRFVGEIPDFPPIPVTKDRTVCGEKVPEEALLVDPKTRGVKDTVVFLEGVTRGKAPDPSLLEATLDNQTCRFIPRVLAMGIGGTLYVKNSDPLLHNVRATLREKVVLNVVLTVKGQVTRRRIRRLGLHTLRCNVHPYMRAYLWTFDHPYFAVTDWRGTFTIKDVPPGTYTLKAWHEGWPGRPEPVLLQRTVKVPPGGTVAVHFDMEPR